MIRTSVLRLVLLALPFTTAPTNVYGQSGGAPKILEGYKEVGRVPLSPGTLRILESRTESTLAVWFDTVSIPSCKPETITDPNRVLFVCSGKLLKAGTPLKLTESAIASRARFSTTDKSTRIVLDIIGELPRITAAPASAGAKGLFLLRGTRTILSDKPATATPTPTTAPTPIAALRPTATATPTATEPPAAPAVAAATAPIDTPPAQAAPTEAGKVPVIVSPPASNAARGETDLYSLVFTRNTELNGPVVKVGLRGNRKVELKQTGPTEYHLTIESTRFVSPIFAAPQTAPDGFDPFAHVAAKEVIHPDKPIQILLKIDLRQAAKLAIRQSGGDIEIYVPN